MFTDSHCHLSFPELAHDLPRIRKAMAEAHVGRALCICTTLEEFAQVHALATGHDNFWATVGVHPDSEGVTEPRLDDLLTRRRLPSGCSSCAYCSTFPRSAANSRCKSSDWRKRSVRFGSGNSRSPCRMPANTARIAK